MTHAVNDEVLSPLQRQRSAALRSTLDAFAAVGNESVDADVLTALAEWIVDGSGRLVEAAERRRAELYPPESGPGSKPGVVWLRDGQY